MSSQGLGRTFSFDYHDEGSPSSNSLPAQPYRDTESPQRTSYIVPPSNYVPSISRQDSITPPSPPAHHRHPAAHPSSSFNNIQAERRYSGGHTLGAAVPSSWQQRASYGEPVSPAYHDRDVDDYGFPLQSRQPLAPSTSMPTANHNHHPDLPLPTDSSDSQTPIPPSHAYASRGLPAVPSHGERRQQGQPLGPSDSMRTAGSSTPGMDNLGLNAAGGGIAGIALGVANTNERESGVEALRAIENQNALGPNTPERRHNPTASNSAYAEDRPRSMQALNQNTPGSFASTVPLGAAADPPGMSTPGFNRSNNSIEMSARPSPDRYMSNGGYDYADNPYNRFSTAWDPNVSRNALGGINPEQIADDDDVFTTPVTRRKSLMGLGPLSNHDNHGGAGAATKGAAAGGILGAMFSRKGHNDPESTRSANSGQYGPVGGGMDGSGPPPEKSEWLSRQNGGNRKMRWIVGVIIVFLLVAVIVGAVIGGVLGSRKAAANKTSAQGQSAKEDFASNGDLTKDSAEIKKLMNNPNLHKVFPGMDYTPFNAQYPECLSNMPSQNNITRDMAVLSQLTNKVRTYGTDCNQTDMIIHAIDKLGLKDMKVWLGVWLEKNTTTNNRQIAQMYKILDDHGDKPFAGLIVGNEVLFREDLTATELGKTLSDVRTNLTSKKINLPIATSDLGDDWRKNPTLVQDADMVMANIHPFFAGIGSDKAAAWTIDFWTQNDIPLTANSPNKKQVISETGWPSGGGKDCGGAGNCTVSDSTPGAVASVTDMNVFMDTFVCQALKNGTEYFWFEAFDEPWKIKYNDGDKNWEDKWGLMDSDRNIKKGVKIPDCGGQSVS
ncbi:MAG: hypothetical protein M1836_006037 [Candelina mexicana]|nr:MAG: hypothetical protein M1836_006037 [Candelina mexicana]